MIILEKILKRHNILALYILYIEGWEIIFDLSMPV